MHGKQKMKKHDFSHCKKVFVGKNLKIRKNEKSIYLFSMKMKSLRKESVLVY